MVVGWQLADHMRTSLVTDALAMALRHGHVNTGAVFHSDRGCQYTSGEFARFCRANRITTSLGKTGQCWDNVPLPGCAGRAVPVTFLSSGFGGFS